MRKYSLVLLSQAGVPEERVEFIADDVTSAFGWAERNAAGRKLEIFEEGRSLGIATLAHGTQVWTLGPASGRRPGSAGGEAGEPPKLAI